MSGRGAGAHQGVALGGVAAILCSLALHRYLRPEVSSDVPRYENSGRLP
ncbi:hypothetical protein [Streptosporangium sp. NPDC087985]